MKTIFLAFLCALVMVCRASPTQSAEKTDLVASAPDMASSPSAENPQTIEIMRKGSHVPTKGPGQYFTGGVQVEQRFPAKGPSRVSGGVVTFEPGDRSAWHTHPFGQILIVTAGIGRVQAWGGPTQEVRAGDVVRIPPHVKHWHGASPTTAMTHLAIQGALEGSAVDWMEQVTDEQYGSTATGSRKPK